MSRPAAHAYVTTDGEVLPASYMQKYALKEDAPQSQQVASDVFEGTYEANGLIEPIYNPAALAQLLDLSTWHARAVKTKAHDVAGIGWALEPADGLDGEPSEETKDRATQLLQNIHPELSLTELLDQHMVDYETTGNAYLEIIRDSFGQPVGMEHVPSHTIRAHADGTKYQQQRGRNKTWFARYGTDERIDMRTGEVGASGEQVANELLHFKAYTPQSDFYGVPDIVPAMGAVLGDQKRQEFNISFFDNHAIPAYAVTLTGADIDEETTQRIKQYFQQDVKDSPHSTLVLTASSDNPDPDAPQPEFKFEKLSTDTKEASFSVFRDQNRDEILSAHGVPPYRAGVIIEGQMGGSSAKESTEIYKQSVINPRRQRLEARLTRALLHDGIGVTDWRIVLGELDTRDHDREIARIEKLFNMGHYTPNDLLKYYGEDESDEPGMDKHYLDGKPIGDTEESRFDALLQSTKQLHSQLAAIMAARKTGDHDKS